MNNSGIIQNPQGGQTSSFFDTDAYRDYYYMTTLSADAAPALADVLTEEGFSDDPESWGYYYLNKINHQYQSMGIRSFNLSKYIAFQVLN